MPIFLLNWGFAQKIKNQAWHKKQGCWVINSLKSLKKIAIS